MLHMSNSYAVILNVKLMSIQLHIAHVDGKKSTWHELQLAPDDGCFDGGRIHVNIKFAANKQAYSCRET